MTWKKVKKYLSGDSIVGLVLWSVMTISIITNIIHAPSVGVPLLLVVITMIVTVPYYFPKKKKTFEEILQEELGNE